MRTNTAQTSPTVVYRKGDYVLYRDPEKFWAGKPGHTFVCRVGEVWSDGTYNLAPLASEYRITHVRPDYMRLLPPIDVMRDIDTAALHGDGAADAMTAAAFAWLAQQHATTNAAPELPTQS
ncbi:hypothetical protein [Streptomyces cinereoruber]|uniref:hypothetical protein n=1 Tax=Streptomyces cinereoruber TaxID=67260 RepID=UPI0036406F2D